MEELILYYGKDTRLIYDIENNTWICQYRKRTFLGLIPLKWDHCSTIFDDNCKLVPRSFPDLKRGVHYLKGWNSDKKTSININNIRFI